MKRYFYILILICLLLPSLAFAKKDKKEEPIPSRFASIMKTCNATTAEEMYQHILDYLNELHPEMDGHYTAKRYPMKICFGWTTKELITNKRKWNMAIVSSKDVELQALADKKLIKHWWFIPNSGQVLPQWLLSDELLSLLPSGIMQSYDIYFFDYDVEAADTTILIMNANSVDASNIPQAMLDMRNVNLKRKMEGIARAENWAVERLISNPESWDTATLLLSDATKQFPDDLKLLDQAGLLFDLSQSNYLASRQVIQKTQPGCSEMLNGYLNTDGKMIAIPVEAFQKANPDELQVFLVNAKSVHVKEALDYGEHYIKACEWAWSPANTWEPTVVNEELLRQFWRWHAV